MKLTGINGVRKRDCFEDAQHEKVDSPRNRTYITCHITSFDCGGTHEEQGALSMCVCSSLIRYGTIISQRSSAGSFVRDTNPVEVRGLIVTRGLGAWNELSSINHASTEHGN